MLDVTQWTERGEQGRKFRDLSFDFNIFDPGLSRERLWTLTHRYCLKPDVSMLNTLGYKYDIGATGADSYSLTPSNRYDVYTKRGSYVGLRFFSNQDCLISIDYSKTY